VRRELQLEGSEVNIFLYFQPLEFYIKDSRRSGGRKTWERAICPDPLSKKRKLGKNLQAGEGEKSANNHR